MHCCGCHPRCDGCDLSRLRPVTAASVFTPALKRVPEARQSLFPEILILNARFPLFTVENEGQTVHHHLTPSSPPWWSALKPRPPSLGSCFAQLVSKTAASERESDFLFLLAQGHLWDCSLGLCPPSQVCNLREGETAECIVFHRLFYYTFTRVLISHHHLPSEGGTARPSSATCWVKDESWSYLVC